MQVFDIEGYNFIKSLHDVAEFQERKSLVERGRGNLTAIEEGCESALSVATNAIETVKRSVLSSVENRFEEMKVAMTVNCDEAKTQLLQLRAELDQFLSSKENRLTPTAELACSNLAASLNVLKFGIVDVSDRISALLSDCWATVSVDINSTLKTLDITEKKTSIESTLAEAYEYAQKGIPKALILVDSLVEVDNSLDQAQRKVLTEILKFEKEQAEWSLKWVQHSWHLRQRYPFLDAATVKVGMKFAKILHHQLGRFSEAENVLKRCYEMEQSKTEVSMSVCNAICEVYFESAQYDKVEQLGEWILDNFGSEEFPSENKWTTLLFLTYSKRRQAKKNEATALLEKWLKLDPREDNLQAEMLRLLTCGIAAYFDKRMGDAGKMLHRAKRIGIGHFPTSPYTAFALFRLTFLSEGDAREYHLLAHSIYEVAAPKSIHAAINLGNLGNFYKDTKLWREAEESYLQAQSIYEVTAPMSIDAANNLGNLGLLLKAAARSTEAEECYRRAQSICEFAAPKSIHAANNLYNLGVLLKEAERWAEAEQCYREAQSIYQVAAPKSVEAADNLLDLGVVYEAKREIALAKDCFEKAAGIYAENGDTKSKSAAENKISQIKKIARKKKNT